MRSELERGTVLVDRYGQYVGESWPGKVTTDAQLGKEAEAEAKLLHAVRPDSAKFDRFGGVRESKGAKVKATGFFRLEKLEGRWWFITPEGNRYILCGVDDVSTNTWGTSTGRPDGENFNQGLMNVCDQPYYEMIEEMKKTNARLYDVHAGQIEPVSRQDLGM